MNALALNDYNARFGNHNSINRASALVNSYAGIDTTYLETQALKVDPKGKHLNWHQKDGQQWRHEVGRMFDGASKLPIVGNHLADHYLKVCRAKSEREANLFFQGVKRRLYLGENGPRFWLLGDDYCLENFVELRLKEIGKHYHVHPFNRYSIVADICGRYFEPHPAIKNEKQLLESGDHYMPGAHFRGCSPALARMEDGPWWRKRISTIQTRTIEQILREVAAVSKRRAPYCSDWAFQNWQEKQEKTRELLNQLAVVDADDDENWATLLEMAAKTVSNKEIRRAELMTRIRGFEEIAIQQGDIGVFITLTCPSRFHATNIHGQPNKKFDGSTPRDAQAWLTERWAKARALFKHYEIMPYGFRIAEPHHDGCPHWHMLLFLPAQKLGALTHSLKKSFLSDELEPGSEEHRLKIKEIDRSRGTAAGYIAKYVSKNIDGAYVSSDRSSNLSGYDSAQRVGSWASTWGIRQMQQIGGPSVQLWRELRRLREPLTEGNKMVSHLSELERASLEAVRRAADEGDWAKFCIAMGGVNVVRKDRSIKLCYRAPEIINKLSGEIKKSAGRYGDAEVLRVVGVVFHQAFLATRFTDWEVTDKARLVKSTGQIMTGVSDVFDLMEKYDLYMAQLEEEYEELERQFYINQERLWLEIDEYDAAEHQFISGD